MKVSRRKFLAVAPIAAGAALALPTAVNGQLARPTRPPVSGDDQLSRLSWISFHQYLYTDFQFRTWRGDAALRLYRMADSRPEAKRRWAHGEECFELIFLSGVKYPIEQGTYTVRHFALGQFDLFITPAGKIEGDEAYIAVINRVLS